MNCPHCGQPLSPAEVKALWASLGGSVKSEAKSKAAKERMIKHWKSRKEDKKNER